MANALARTSYVTFREGEGLVIGLDCYFVGSDVPNGIFPVNVDVVISSSDQPAAIRAAMSKAVTESATANGFVCVGSNMTLPTFQKG